MSMVKVAAIQMDSQNDKQENIKKADSMIREAVLKGAELVTLPEYFNFIGEEKEEEENAEYIESGETVVFLKNIAKELNVWLHGGSILEKVDGNEKYYNTTLFINKNGEVVSAYRKIHLYDVEINNGPSHLESKTKNFGTEIVVSDTDFAKIGLTICYDVRFPELFRLQALEGAEIAIVPAEFTLFTGRDHWEVLLRARAIENQLYVIAPGQIGNKPAFQSYGRSMIVDPWGTVIATSSDKESVLISEIDLAYLRGLRKQVPSLSNRRPEVYNITKVGGVKV
ncbi:carbon-nitrogen hydrolase family protein [Oceanobacillus indicireducens]|uniref:Carbon-nitrogen hydrolase n=1 Tax=Oceanobacillus indicireducens TaxID=1004261 RepID=A0A917XZL2_9BACI|nr:carbon-nitrogen hydrolase family protein [Oceanobacillus indicireducens]GGN59658.1 carbon-nitrogen hydrolase [Oceanobacillus indicireducens]